MSATTAQPPVIPPRPSRSQERSSIPMVPPRPANRHLERSLSPNHARFAPSPLNAGFPAPKSGRQSHLNGENGDAADKVVDLPSLGQEGMEYAGLEALSASRSNSPEQTRTIGDDVKLHAPKPSLPAVSAKQRVMAVTRTDSDKAASFGIGRPSSNNDDSSTALPPNRSLKKKASTTSQLSTNESHHEDEQGIPEIGVQVPMYPNAGDVQAPSPAPGSISDGPKGRHHARKTSSRGNLPPGSYGLHGHGVLPQDKLEKAYYEKHPELLKKEHTPHHHDRPNDFSMSSDDLNKIVRETASRGAGLAVKNYAGTPSDQVGWQAIEESASRVASPRPGSTDFKSKSPVKGASAPSDSEKETTHTPEEKEVIHIDDPNRRRAILYGEGEAVAEDEIERPYTAPILAEDELAKDPGPYDHQPAVELPSERRGSEDISRPSSRPASLYKEASYELRPTPLEDVEEYEPLFTEEEKEKPVTKEEKIKKEHKRRFPSADIWEDAPSSVHYTAEVSTPEPAEERAKESTSPSIPPRDGETPAQAFARRQEELAEMETRERGPEAFLPGQKKTKPSWTQQPHLVAETASSRPSMAQRFPSRDVWEDTPESLQLETTVSGSQQEEEQSPVEPKSPVDSKPEVPARKPSIPERPKPKTGPAVSDRPKPQIPARPVKAGPTSGGQEPADAAAPPRQKPAVPARPMGSKIAALQAGFMNDLNKRLQLGPQAPKKEEPAAEDEPAEEKEKAPLADARKGRARGPQRRAPAKSSSPAPAVVAAPATTETPKLSFSMTVTLFDLDPEEGVLQVTSKPLSGGEESKEESPVEEIKKDEATIEQQPADEEKEEVKIEEPEKEEIKTLATNTAGEPLIEETVKEDAEEQKVEPTAVEEH
ncbi:Altered inheritance of mitochondria protein 21 [Naviculisporaceae sp. PSN 640]